MDVKHGWGQLFGVIACHNRRLADHCKLSQGIVTRYFDKYIHLHDQIDNCSLI